jgi:bifunctional non-homologous end joining protein LigD
MLAKEAAEAFDDSGWLYEIKWDGYRAIAETGNSPNKLYSRNGVDFSNSYPVVFNELKSIKHKAVLDGEIVILNEDGFPDFQKLQHYDDNQNFPICYFIFDLLEMDGEKLYHLPLTDRKELLKKLIPENDVLRFSDHVMEKGVAFFEASVQKNLEGIMAKKADGEYYPGKRTNEWLKIKNHKTADVIICGYTAPTGSRQYFGSLVLGIMKDKKLVHAGHAGSGYDDKKLKEIYELLQPLVQENSPFAEKVPVNNAVTWVKPKLICEVKFTEWTADEKLRHPVFLRIRNDKSINQITMEAQSPEKIISAKWKTSVVPKEETSAAKEKKSKKNDDDNYFITDGKNKVQITHPDKIYFPDDKVTKKMVADYYQEIAPYILPFLKERPESLKRNPGGINGPGFFHKDAGENAPDFVQSFAVHSDSTNKEIDYIICNDKATLAYLNSLGCIELNPWHSTIKNPHKPDYMIIDIDPSDKNNFEQVIETANTFKKVLDKAGAKSFCKTSGATGLHIYVPMKQKYDYEEVKNFAQLLCMYVNEMLPDFTTMERNLKKRGDKKIYLDFLQNRSGQTISSVYSLRPKKGATVSMPLDWKEVKKGLTPQHFTIFNAVARIKKNPDIFKGILGAGTNIQKCLKLLGSKKV